MKNLVLLSLVLFSSLLTAQNQIDSLINEGVKFHDEKNYQKAIEKYKEALRIDSNSWLANYEIAFTYFELKAYDDAIKYAEKSIKNDKNNSYYSYVVLGSAYDLIANPKKAIKIYKKGIKKFPDKYLLHYNLALTTYNLNDLKSAEHSAISAIQLNPNHTTSHLLLAYINNKNGQRSKAVLSLYYFLMLEADSPRSKEALDLLKGLLKKGVTRRDEKNIDIKLTMNDDDDFGSSELMMSLLEASKSLEENKDKSAGELFYENTESFFTILTELNKKGKNKGFHKSFYVPFFKKMVKDEHVETLSYYIQKSSKDKEVLLWLELNGDKINKFGRWYEETEH